MRKKSLTASLLHHAALACLATLSHLAHADGLIDRHIDWNDAGGWRSQFGDSALDTRSGPFARRLDENRLSRTFRQSSEAYLTGKDTSDMAWRMGNHFGPNDPGDIGRLQDNGRNQPGGHIAGAAALVAPPILEYARENPFVWGLAAIPAYQMAAQAKLQSNWQTDVLAGAVMGVSAGYLTHRDSPFFLRKMSQGVFIGIHNRF